MQEQRMLSRPAQLWQSAVRAVRGEDTEKLIERFTAEMTLVAEGLAEDQCRVREAVERIGAQQDRAEERAGSEMQALESMMRENQRDADMRMEALEKRLAALEGKIAGREKQKKREHTVLDRVTVMVSIASGAWVLTAVIGLFH